MPKKQLYQLEYTIKSSPVILYDFLSTTAGLSQWFADHVDNNGNHFIFSWSGSNEEAELIESQEPTFVRFRWSYQDKNEYFEFRVKVSEFTRDTILMITDFAEPKEIKDASNLWESQVKMLKQQVGGLG